MTLSDLGKILLGALSFVLVFTIIGILYYMYRKHRRGRHNLRAWLVPNNTLVSDSVYDDTVPEEHVVPPPSTAPESSLSNPMNGVGVGGGRESDVPQAETGDRAIETHASYIIPDGVQLLRTCKALTHKLMASVIDGTSKDRSRVMMLNNLEGIISAAKDVSPAVDRLTQSMYPPIDEQNMLLAATDLVTAVEELVKVTKSSAAKGTMAWLDPEVAGVLRDFKVVVASIQRFRVQREQGPDFSSDV